MIDDGARAQPRQPRQPAKPVDDAVGWPAAFSLPRLLPAWAGICYVAAWAAGLASWPANPALNATNAQVAAAYGAHPAGVAAQYLLSEGLAGLLLGVVLAWTVYISGPLLLA